MPGRTGRVGAVANRGAWFRIEPTLVLLRGGPVMNARLMVYLIAVLGGGVLLLDVYAQSRSREEPLVVALTGRLPLGVTLAENDLITHAWRASRLTAAEVYNDRDEKIGRVDDVLVAPDGSLSIAIVDVGEFLGRGRHLVAVPARQFVKVKPRAVLPGATKDALQRMPPFHYSG